MMESESEADTDESPLPSPPLVDLCEDDDPMDGSSSAVPWIHPLQDEGNELLEKVLKKIFNQLKPKDLMTCREVCKTWNKFTISIVRSKIQISVFGSKLKSFNDLMNRNTLGIPFGNFRLGAFDMVDPDGPGQEFLQFCGNSALKIDLRNAFQVHSIEDVGEILKLAPNLEEFVMPMFLNSTNRNIVKLFPGDVKPTLPFLKSFTSGLEVPAGRQKFCPTFFEEFFTAAPNVSTLQLLDSLNESVSVEVLKVLEKLGREPLIQNLTLSTVTLENCEILYKMSIKREGLKLKILKIKRSRRVGLAGQGDSLWFEIVKIFKDSLVLLYVNKICMDKISFPLMPKLRLMGLHISRYTHFEVKDSNFYGTFPNLKLLRILCSEQIGTHQWNELIDGAENQCCPKMGKLSLQGIAVTIQSFERTVHIFPGLTTLDIDLFHDGDKILRTIWTEMIYLKYLNVRGILPPESSIDSLITGISAEEIFKLGDPREASLALRKLTPEARKEEISLLTLPPVRILPSILNLTSLRYLGLNLREVRVGALGEFEGYRHLSDMTGYFALYSMKQLRDVNILQCDFSKTCSNILVADLNLQTWTFQDEWKQDIIAPGI